MKPLQLSMHHFGPFIDEQIDFTKLDKELFLIAGPTGSGKTTIFDGLCYALYGEGSNTSRQSREMKSQFGNPTEMMWVAFTFALRDKIYRIRRIPEQERKKERGEGMAKQKHEAVLYEIQEGKEVLLSSSLSEIGDKILSLLGINANQFRQIIMLPQGEFSRLLKAKEEERIELLKSIFRMDVYSKLRDKTADRLRDVRKTHDALLVRMDAEKKHFNAEEGSDFEQELKSEAHNLAYLLAQAGISIEKDKEEKKIKTDEERKLKKERDQLKITLSAGAEINARFEKYKTLKKHLETLEAQKETMEKDAIRLEKGEKAIQIRQLEDHLKIGLQKEVSIKAAVKQAQKDRVTAETESETLLEKYQYVMDAAYDTAVESLKENQSKRIRLLDNVNVLKKQETEHRALSQKRKNLEETVVHIEKDKEEVNKRQEEAQKLERQKFTLEKEAQALRYSMTEQTTYRAQLQGILEQLNDITLREEKIKTLRNDWKTAQAECRQSEKDYKDLLVRQKEAVAESLSAGLVAGEPCPVCGSVHHPKINQGAKDGVSETVLKKAEKQYQQWLAKCETLKSDGRTRAEERDKRIAELKKTSETLPVFKGEQADKSTTENLLAVADLETKKREEQEKNLTAELKTLKEKQEQQETMLKDLKKRIQSVERLEKELKTISAQDDEFKGQLRQIKDIVEKLANEIDYTLDFKNGNTDELIKQRQANQLLIEEKIGYKDNIRLRYQTLETKRATLKADDINFSAQLKKCTAENGIMQENFESALKKAMLDQESYEAYKDLSESVLEELKKTSKQYEFDLRSTQQRLAEMTVELEHKTPVDLEAFKEDQEMADQKLEEIQQIVVRLNERVNGNQDQIDKLTGLASELEVIENEQGIYTKLDQTIKGTLAGRPKISFERYILSAYLGDILDSANLFLEKMSGGRYRLEVMEDLKKNRGLEIEVVDAYTGLRRSANTLSGGETFMAALSMALGLSDIVQAYAGGIVLDTIFIDEGFATLDPEALDNAINCLLGIKNDGRTVGIISHVEELKERIDTKITVVKTETGSHILMNNERKSI